MWANKRLGQHFLSNAGVVARIADQVAAMAPPSREVIEIGPGPGPLTGALLARGLRVQALEIDARMIEHLNQEYAAQIADGQLTLLSGDALKFDLALLRGDAWTVCGNLPYNVGTQILFRFFEECPRAINFCYMLQKEVVLRFISPPGGPDYGLAGVKLAWGATVGGHFWVKPGSFTPPPRVDSGVFWFERSVHFADPLERGGNYDRAGLCVSKFFQHRRKMLRAVARELATSPYAERRPQELDPRTLYELALNLVNNAETSQP